MAAQVSRPAALWKTLRPHQWIKNVLVFGGLAFTGRWHRATSGGGLGAMLDWQAIGYAVAAFAIFCLLSSVGYLVNDVRDREADRQHPQKRHRPIASGALSVGAAVATAGILATVALAGAAVVAYGRPEPQTRWFLTTAVAYLVVTNWYSFQLKHLVIVDALTISALFVLRAIAGCFAIPEPPSPWIIVCTMFGALFIGLCKRRGELVAVTEADAGNTRPVLAKYHTGYGYSAGMLDQMIQMAGTATIMTYAMYTFVRPKEIGLVGEQAGLMFTIPFVVYGVFRYLYLVHKQDIGQNPERLFRDRGMLINLALWALVVVYVTRGRGL